VSRTHGRWHRRTYARWERGTLGRWERTRSPLPGRRRAGAGRGVPWRSVSAVNLSTATGAAIAGLWLSTVAILIGAATLAFVVYGHVVDRRKWPDVFWDFHRYGDGTHETVPVVFCELTQLGRGPALLTGLPTVVGGEILPTEDRRLRTHFGGHDSQKLLLRTADPEAVWILLIETPLHDRRWVRVAWAPLEPCGPDLATERDRQSDMGGRARLRNRVTRLRTRWIGPEPVGPGGVPATRVRTTSRRLKSGLEIAMSIARAAEHQPVPTDGAAAQSPTRPARDALASPPPRRAVSHSTPPEWRPGTPR
jgi:hypothetical protein